MYLDKMANNGNNDMYMYGYEMSIFNKTSTFQSNSLKFFFFS